MPLRKPVELSSRGVFVKSASAIMKTPEAADARRMVLVTTTDRECASRPAVANVVVGAAAGAWLSLAIGAGLGLVEGDVGVLVFLPVAVVACTVGLMWFMPATRSVAGRPPMPVDRLKPRASVPRPAPDTVDDGWCPSCHRGLPDDGSPCSCW